MKIRATLLLAAVPLLLAAEKPEWIKFAPKDEKFSISLPKAPRDLSPKASADAPIRSKVYMCQPAAVGDAVYTVNVTEMPGKVTPDDVRDGLISGSKDKVESEKPFQVGTAKGKEFTIKTAGPSPYKRVRVCVVKATIYQWMVSGSEADVKGKDADMFLTSFELTESPNK